MAGKNILRYIVKMEGGLEPGIHGPYTNDKFRDKAAQEIHREMDEGDNIFALDINFLMIKNTIKAEPHAWTWSGGFFEGEGND